MTLAEIDDGPWGDALLEDVRRHMGQEWMPAYGLSIACQETPGEMVLPFEVSLTTRPSFSDAKVLAASHRRGRDDHLESAHRSVGNGKTALSDLEWT